MGQSEDRTVHPPKKPCKGTLILLYRKLEYYPCALDLETEKKKKRTWFHATEEKKRCTSPFLWKMIRLHAPCFRVWIGGYVCSTLAVSPSKKETGHDLSALTGTSVRNV